jgi:hypothetical protein
VLSYDPTAMDVATSKKVEISSSGFEHYLWGLNDNDYLYMILEVTQVADQAFFEYLFENYCYWYHHKSQILKDFLNYLIYDDATSCHIPDHPAYRGQQIINKRFSWRIGVLDRWIADGRN